MSIVERAEPLRGGSAQARTRRPHRRVGSRRLDVALIAAFVAVEVAWLAVLAYAAYLLV